MCWQQLGLEYLSKDTSTSRLDQWGLICQLVDYLLDHLNHSQPIVFGFSEVLVQKSLIQAGISNL